MLSVHEVKTIFEYLKSLCLCMSVHEVIFCLLQFPVFSRVSLVGDSDDDPGVQQPLHIPA